MNSLAYLSRQFDVLASPKTPNSTPTAEHASFLSDKHTPASQQNSSLKRVSTWSTKSLFFSPSSRHTRTSPRSRSASSPDFVTLASQRALISPASPSLESQTRPVSKLETVIKRIFFIRVFALAWDALCATWASFKRTGTVGSKREIVGQTVLTQEIKDRTTDEERVPLLQETPPTPPPPIPPPLPAGRHAAFPFLNRSPEPPDSKPEPSSSYLSVTSSSSSIVITQTTDLPASASRSSTPSLPARKTPFHLPKTLVLDLDETLIHSTSRPLFSSVNGGSGLLGIGTFGNRNKGTGHMVEVVLGGRSTIYHVYKRPFVDFFLRTVSGWYTLVIFTASMQEYADPVIDWLDAGRGILARRLFRDSCTQLPNGSYTKDLAIVEQDLSRVCLVDNSPISYHVNEANGIPIEGWTHDPSDEALLDLLPVLDSLRFTSDVRRVLGIRGFS